MNAREHTAAARGSRLSGCLVFVLLVGALGIGVSLGWLGERALKPPTPERSRSVAPAGTVVRAVRDLARLETTSFHVERVIDMREGQSRFFGLLQATDQVLLVASGDVTAGIDLTKMGDADVIVDPSGQRAVLRLPPPQILSTRLDNERTYVHTRKTDLLAERSAQLETAARQQAEQYIRDAALDAGVLKRARRNAEHTLRSLLRGLGFDRVEIRWQDRQTTGGERRPPDQTRR